MKVLICGDRKWEYGNIIEAIVWGLYGLFGQKLIIIQGEANGADSMARDYAKVILQPENILCFPADWQKYGKAAGPIRNKQMLELGKPDLVIGFHSDIQNSKGTKNMLEQAKEKEFLVMSLEDIDYEDKELWTDSLIEDSLVPTWSGLNAIAGVMRTMLDEVTGKDFDKIQKELFLLQINSMSDMLELVVKFLNDDLRKDEPTESMYYPWNGNIPFSFTETVNV